MNDVEGLSRSGGLRTAVVPHSEGPPSARPIPLELKTELNISNWGHAEACPSESGSAVCKPPLLDGLLPVSIVAGPSANALLQDIVHGEPKRRFGLLVSS